MIEFFRWYFRTLFDFPVRRNFPVNKPVNDSNEKPVNFPVEKPVGRFSGQQLKGR